MSEGVVYSFGFTDVAPHIIGAPPLDGDIDKIEYADTSLDPGLNPLFKPGRMYAGRAVKPEHIPTRVQWQSKRYKPYDVFMSGGLILVSDAFKDIIGNHEPGVHQFFPIEVVYRDGSFARQMYFFNICNRLDAMDRDRATAEFQDVLFEPRTGSFVFSLDKVGSAHAWIDKHVHHGTFLSSAVVDDIKQAGLTGIAFHSYPAF
ncbi:imm11 family protein [Pannonibacter phragmitetus]|uniref:imm11 family protein n=2 Tax=Pannonibacter phragmitetus TaxID=121719 RepID=UPI000B10D4AD|nr:DUF1629 domain-containing protein [Pannonibacter phragmitetus]